MTSPYMPKCIRYNEEIPIEFTTLPSSTPAPEVPAEPEAEPPKPTWAHGLFGCFDMDTKLREYYTCSHLGQIDNSYNSTTGPI